MSRWKRSKRDAWAKDSAKAKAPSTHGRPMLRRLAWLGGLVGVLVAGLVFLFFYSAAFVVRDLSVTGVEGELADSVEAHAQIPHGRPLARVSQANVEARVLEDPRIASVEVIRDWPSGITLDAHPRKAALVLRQKDATWLADTNGVVFDEVSEPSRKLPSVRVSEPPTEMSEETVRGLVELWRLRPDPAELEGRLGTPRLASDGAVSMKVDQLTIVWGAPVEAERKWAVVKALVGQDSIDPQGGIPQTIDVSIPETPVVTGLPEASQN
ncbi:cell division protein FtsQ/DivIB [Ornithinimicrobium sp. Y1694]|uniref:cell division protein FtsQ/DivIB n=1 Tax=Ornithinimicrobium sp. Y1694 TaxID=3418590 RepID=UPI003CF6DB50